jgi:hypothetical protein
MFGMNRVRRMFGSNNMFSVDTPFETYYGTLLRDRQEGGPNAQEARRDFETIRQSISRLSVY